MSHVARIDEIAARIDRAMGGSVLTMKAQLAPVLSDLTAELRAMAADLDAHNLAASAGQAARAGAGKGRRQAKK